MTVRLSRLTDICGIVRFLLYEGKVHQSAPDLAASEDTYLSPRHVVMAATGDVHDPRTWSGTPYFMAHALEKAMARVSYVSPVQTSLVTRIGKIARLQARLTGWKTMPAATWFAARQNAQALEHALAGKQIDAIFAPAGSAVLAALQTDVPLVYTSDATVRLMVDYYGQFTDLSRGALREVEELEAAAISRAALLLYPTEWTARSAVKDYGADPSRIRIMPYGANLMALPDRETALAPRRPGPLRLIFVGVDWKRKGGAIAVDALRALNAGGIPAEMTVVGCVPPDNVALDNITVHPFLSKNDPAQLRALCDLYLDADLLLVPTRAECYGVIWCEAAAHGLPSIATATGGVPDVVHDGVTGHTLPPEADGAAYAERIAGLWEDQKNLARLKRAARDDFETRLDWNVWSRNFATALDGHLATR